MQICRRWLPLGAAALLLVFAACEPDEQEQSKFPRSDGSAFKTERNISEMHFVQLENGVSFYMKEDHADNRVAIEVFYNAGLYTEPEGKIQVAHLAEHLRPKGSTASYKAGEQLKEISHLGGRLAAEVAADCVHYDYIVPADKVGHTLAMEIERLTSLDFDENVMRDEVKAAAGEFDVFLQENRGTLTRYAFMALNQAYNYGADFVPILGGLSTLSAEDIKSFCKSQYRTQDIIVIIVGGIDFATAEALVREHFGTLPRSPEPETSVKRLTNSKRVGWDINADAVFHLYPGPYGEFRDRLMLTMFGVYLNAVINRSESYPEIAVTTYVTNTVYPVRELPFFLFGMPQIQSSPERLEELLDERLAIAIETVDDRMLGGMKRSLTDFVTATMVREDAYHHDMMRSQVTGQEAVNTGIRHQLREGLTNEEFVEMVNSVTLDEMHALLARVFAPGRKIAVRFDPQE